MAQRDRLTVIETIYYQPFGEEASASDNRYSCELKTSGQQLYGPRKLKATQEWQQLDVGWLKDGLAGMFSIKNIEGLVREKLPSADELKEVATRIIEITYDPEDDRENPLCWEIPPGQSFQGKPSHIDKLYIRTQFGTAKYLLTVFPK